MDGSTILTLTVQALLAVAGLRLLLVHVFPRLPRHPRPTIVADVWGPIAIVGPMLVMAARVEGGVGGVGWLPLGAPATVALAGVGATLLVGGGAPAPGWRAPLAAAGAGVLLLLLGGAHDLTIWVGQSTFAIAAVLLWINAPGADAAGAATGGTGPALLGALACAAGQGACGYALTDPAAVAVSAGLMAGAATVAVVGSAAAGAAWPLRIGAWCGALGTFFGVGIISVVRMTPPALEVLLGRSVEEVGTNVAHGFGAYALEATALLVVPILGLAAGRTPSARWRVIGGIALAAAALVMASRAAGLAVGAT